jgi:hypothetical protein
MSFRLILRTAVALLAVTPLAVPALSVGAQEHAATPTVVIIVRHGEKAPLPANDPELSEEGKARDAAVDEPRAGGGLRLDPVPR